MLRDIIIALSLSNLCFVSAWRSLFITASLSYYYFKKTLPPTVEYLSLILAVILVALILFLGIRVVRLVDVRVRTWAKVLFVLILSGPLYGLLSEINNSFVLRLLTRITRDAIVSQRLVVSLILAITLFLVGTALLKINSASRIAIGAILILAPLVLITFSQAIFLAIKYRSRDKSAPTISQATAHKSPRILWMVFDEFDFRVAFAERPNTVKLPQLDRLASESLFASNAYPPAGDTLLSLPALITGKLISEAHPEGPETLMIKYRDGESAVSWETQPNIFSRARAAGVNTALYGWYHPYCRVLGNNLTKCDWEGQMTAAEMTRAVRGEPQTISNNWTGLLQGLLKHVRTAAFTFPLVTRLSEPPSLDVAQVERDKDILDFKKIYDQTVDAVNNPELGLILVHWPIPHSPNIYDRSTHQISAGPGHSYLDSLEMVDDTLGKIRASMEAQGSWDNTVILISSDHWWRSMWRKEQPWTAEDESTMGNSSDRRIPFILKLPGKSNKGIVYQPEFNTVLSHDLLLAILQRAISDNNGAADWLDKHRSTALVRTTN